MKHLQTFNERNFLKQKYKDDDLILKIIKSIKEVCPPKNVKNIFHKMSNKKPKLFSLKPLNHEKFQTITFFTTIKDDIKEPILNKPSEKGILKYIKSKNDENDFYVANVKIELIYIIDVINSHMYINTYVNDNKLICNPKYKGNLYSLLCDYIKNNKL